MTYKYFALYLYNCFHLPCRDPAVNALKFLDVISMKDTSQKSHFYKVTLIEAMPLIPRVSLIYIYIFIYHSKNLHKLIIEEFIEKIIEIIEIVQIRILKTLQQISNASHCQGVKVLSICGTLVYLTLNFFHAKFTLVHLSGSSINYNWCFGWTMSEQCSHGVFFPFCSFAFQKQEERNSP